MKRSSEKSIYELKPGYAQIPSWRLSKVNLESFDLITATTVLNEINYAGIGYFVEQVLRLLKVGGYLYIKDSAKTKPGRHNIDYEKFLIEAGFEQVSKLDNLEHRKNIHGVPRLYKRIKHSLLDFETIMETFTGHTAMTLHGDSKVQNIESQYLK